MFKANGVELDFNVNDIDVAKMFDEEVDKVIEVADGNKDDSYSYGKKVCDSVRAMYDRLFGDGTGIKVTGKEYDMYKHLTAFEAIVEEQQKQVKLLDDLSKKMQKRGNRATRRAADK